ncbi:MAG: hypothetical protein RLZZ511_3941, partial [Cyanobacteriota bacterium]
RRVSSFLRRAIWVSPLFYLDSRPLTQNSEHSLARGNVRVFALVSGQLRRQQMADLFVNILTRLEKFTQSNNPPFIAKIYKDGRMDLWKDQAKLLGLSDREINTDP